MKHSLRGIGLGIALATLVASGLALSSNLHAQSSPDTHSAMHSLQGGDQHGDAEMMMQHHAASESALPTLPGQDAFGAIQEIVHILDADPNTDWSRINLEALRQHLIDMNEVTLTAEAQAKPIEGGLQIAVTGEGRTKEGIQRMVTAHAHELEYTHLNGWSAKTDALPNGVVLTVTAADPKEVAHIRGLGFIGIMTSGPHHQPHHLAIARGEMMH